MKILAYAHTYVGAGHNAGAETTLHGMMLAVKRAGHSVFALASRPFKDGSGSYVIDGVRVQAYASKQDPELYFPHYDLILTQFECAQRAWYIAMKLNIPTVQVVHNNTEYSRNLALRYNDALVYNSRHVQQDISSRFPAEKVKPSVLLHPVVDPRVYKVDTTREYITLVNLSDGEPPFYNKGYETFYELAERFPDQKFLGVKGAYGNQVVRKMKNVTIVEHTNNILDIYRKSKVVLMPSEIESWGRVAIEAGCSAIPSLTSTAPGLVESGIGWKAIPFNSHNEWETALRSLLDNYPKACYTAKEKAETLYKMSKEEEAEFVTFLDTVKPTL